MDSTPRVSLRKNEDQQTVRLYGKEYIKGQDGELYPVEDVSSKATDSFSQQNAFQSFKIQLQPEEEKQDRAAEFAEPKSFPEVEVVQTQDDTNVKFCRYCGGKIHSQAVVCTHCGRQVEELRRTNVVNTNVTITPTMAPMGKRCNKWLSLLLCFFLGFWGVHRFYEGKIGTGILWLLTVGMFGIGWFVDFWLILVKQNPYYVK